MTKEDNRISWEERRIKMEINCKIHNENSMDVYCDDCRKDPNFSKITRKNLNKLKKELLTKEELEEDKREYMRKYNIKYRQTKKGIESKKKSMDKYLKTEKCLETRKKYRQTAKYREICEKYNESRRINSPSEAAKKYAKKRYKKKKDTSNSSNTQEGK